MKTKKTQTEKTTPQPQIIITESNMQPVPLLPRYADGSFIVPDGKKYFSVDQAAKRFKCKPETLRQMFFATFSTLLGKDFEALTSRPAPALAPATPGADDEEADPDDTLNERDWAQEAEHLQRALAKYVDYDRVRFELDEAIAAEEWVFPEVMEKRRDAVLNFHAQPEEYRRPALGEWSSMPDLPTLSALASETGNDAMVVHALHVGLFRDGRLHATHMPEITHNTSPCSFVIFEGASRDEVMKFLQTLRTQLDREWSRLIVQNPASKMGEPMSAKPEPAAK